MAAGRAARRPGCKTALAHPPCRLAHRTVPLQRSPVKAAPDPQASSRHIMHVVVHHLLGAGTRGHSGAALCLELLPWGAARAAPRQTEPRAPPRRLESRSSWAAPAMPAGRPPHPHPTHTNPLPCLEVINVPPQPGSHHVVQPAALPCGDAAGQAAVHLVALKPPVCCAGGRRARQQSSGLGTGRAHVSSMGPEHVGRGGAC